MDNAINTAPQRKQGPKLNSYLIFLLLLDLILPLASIFIDHVMNQVAIDPALVGKWVLFFSVGVRVFIAGLVQVVSPGFTATKIFRFRHKESYPVIRELGFGNISLGVIGMLSLAKVEWRGITSIAAGIFFGLAGVQHLLRKPDSFNEIVAMITDQLVFVIMLLYVFFVFIN
jgi:hypothetical protein